MQRLLRGFDEEGQMSLVATISSWQSVLVITVFAILLTLVLLLPMVLDLVTAGETVGLARATMALAVIAIFGFVLVYILIETPLRNNFTIINSGVAILGTTLAAVTAFYFGTKLATTMKPTTAGEAGANAAMTVPLAVNVVTPAKDAEYEQNSTIQAKYSCSGLDVTCVGSVPSGTPIDTSMPGDKTFSVRATDYARAHPHSRGPIQNQGVNMSYK
jgi:hypothetical protein